ncbi:MAG: PQQ-binding-like beta-propeller repeat protein [Nanoarchaeota archaeon]|nr:PQQ-binding-like beta-propeller repeat protein [Nanoarchaeota archaeon]
MATYINDSQLDVGNVSFDTSSFSDVEWVGILAAIAQTDRSQVFNVGIGGSFYSHPLLHGNAIYIGCCDKNFYALDAATGRERWRFPTKNAICGSPSLWEDVLYFGSYDGNLYAVGLDGKLVWKFSTNSKIYSMPAIADNLIVFGNQDGEIIAVDQNGTKMWSAKAEGAICSDPWYEQGRIFIGSFDKNLYALDAKTGAVLWRFSGNGIIGSPVVKNNIIYVPCFDGNLYALGLDGKLKWKFPTDVQVQTTRPAVWNDTIYFVTRQGVLYAVNTNGQLIWKFPTNDILFTTPIIENGILYFGGDDFNFYALDAKTGELQWKHAVRGPINTKAVFYKKTIIFASNECKVHALTLKGNSFWNFRAAISTPSPIDVEPPRRGLQTTETVAYETTAEEENRYRMENQGVADSFGASSTYVVKSEYTPKSKYSTK